MDATAIEEIRARLKECPLSLSADADWAGTNHYEVHDRDTGGEGYWWLVVNEVDLDGYASLTPAGKRLGAVLDYACAYRRDVEALLGIIDGGTE